jgi:HPt (histidine-containing phosphotransfer) domain-containing protein
MAKEVKMQLEESIQSYIPQFLENRKKDLGRLSEALKSQNYEEITRIGHTIKGVSRPFGFSGLETLGLKIEEAGIRNDLGYCRDLYTEFEKTLAEEIQKLE